MRFWNLKFFIEKNCLMNFFRGNSINNERLHINIATKEHWNFSTQISFTYNIKKLMALYGAIIEYSVNKSYFSVLTCSFSDSKAKLLFALVCLIQILKHIIYREI